jgi:hypothetical protein
MPDPKTYKQHFESKHPKSALPEELKSVWISGHNKLVYVLYNHIGINSKCSLPLPSSL